MAFALSQENKCGSKSGGTDEQAQVSPSLKEDRLGSFTADDMKEETLTMPSKPQNKPHYTPLSITMSAQQIINTCSGQGKHIGQCPECFAICVVFL